MSLRVAERLMRFGLSVLAVGIILRLLAVSIPTEYISPVAERVDGVWEGVLAESLWESVPLFARGVLLALPLALFGGWLVRWGAALGHWTSALATALYGLPFFGLLMLAIYSLSLRNHWVSMGWATHVALILGLWPLLSLAVARGLQERAQPALAVSGRLLGETGNILMVALIAGLFLMPDWGVLRLLELAVRHRDPGVVHTVFALGILPVLLCHLVSDLLLLRTEPDPAAPVTAWRLSAGLALASILVAMAVMGGSQPSLVHDKFMPPGDEAWLGADEQGRGLLSLLGPSTRGSLALAFAAAGVSTAAGLLLAGAGRLLGPVGRSLLSPRVPAFSLWAPLAAAIGLLTLFGRNQLTLGAALALAGVLPMAYALRGVLASLDSEDRRAALTAAAGALLLVVNQNLVAEMTLGALGMGLPRTVLSLGLLARGAVLISQAPHMLIPALLAATGMAGLSLTGYTLLGAAPVAEEPEAAAEVDAEEASA